MQNEQTFSSFYSSSENEGKDQQLWQIAKKRAAFKISLLMYILVNCFLVAVWYFTSHRGGFWPMWPILGWGIGVVLQYFGAYHQQNLFSAEQEYEKLKNQN